MSKPRAVGMRPRCLHCKKELRPVYRDNEPRPNDFYLWSKKQKADWNREHKLFTGNYGGYSDNRFCGLNCGYNWAWNHSKSPL